MELPILRHFGSKYRSCWTIRFLLSKWFLSENNSLNVFFNDDEGCDCRTWLALNRNDALVIKLKLTSCETNGYRTNMFHQTRLPKRIRLEKAKACQGRPSERANIWTEHQQWIIRLKLLVFRKVILNTIHFALIAIK